MRKQSLLRGTIILAIAGILAKFMGIFFRLPLIMLIGDEGIGYYQMSYPLYTFFIAVASGIPIAISKLVAEKNAVGDRIGAVQVLKNALLLMFILGGGFTAFLLIFSKDLIVFFKWDYKAYYSLLGIAFAPLIISVMSSFRGFFQGMQNMYPTAVSQIIEQLGRVCLGIGLAYLLLPKGIHVAAGGAAFGAASGGILAGAYLIISYMRVRKEFSKSSVKRNKEILSTLLYIAIPISLGATAGSIMSLIDSFLVPQKLLQAGFKYAEATALYGQLTGKAFVLVSVPFTLSMALCTSLVPVIAESHLLGKVQNVAQKMDMALKISVAIAIPSFFGLYFMAAPILGLIFPGHSDGYKILQLLSFSIPFIVLSQCCTSILQGIGKYVLPVLNLGLGCIVKVIITYVLVSKPHINIYGAAIGTIAGYAVSAILNFNLIRKVLNIKLNYYEILIKPVVASIIMIIVVVFIYINVYNYTVTNSISTVIAIAAGGAVYIFLIIISGVFKYSYIKKRLFK